MSRVKPLLPAGHFTFNTPADVFSRIDYHTLVDALTTHLPDLGDARKSPGGVPAHPALVLFAATLSKLGHRVVQVASESRTALTVGSRRPSSSVSTPVERLACVVAWAYVSANSMVFTALTDMSCSCRTWLTSVSECTLCERRRVATKWPDSEAGEQSLRACV